MKKYNSITNSIRYIYIIKKYILSKTNIFIKKDKYLNNKIYSYSTNNPFKWDVDSFIVRLSSPLHSLPNYSLCMSDSEIFSLIEEFIISFQEDCIYCENSSISSNKPVFFKKRHNIYIWKDIISLLWLIYIYHTSKDTIIINNKTYTYYCVYYFTYESLVYKGDTFCEFSFDTDLTIDNPKIWEVSDIIENEIENNYVNNMSLHNKQSKAYDFVLNNSGFVFDK